MTVTSTTPSLFTPLKVGDLQLQHRVAMAPLTRFRTPNHIPPEVFGDYYEQRASRAGTLIVTEATLIAPQAGGYENVPGIWSQEQIKAWKSVMNKINGKKSYAFMQLWALGRVAHQDILDKEGVASDVVSASDVPLGETSDIPRPLTELEIKEYIRLYAQAAKNAIEAGASGVELHGANGYLPDQFLHESTNRRTDEYGGSIENRARFALEVIDALIEAVGAKRVAVRLSPFGEFNNMHPGVSPIPQWSYLISELERRAQQGNRLAYIHLVEPRVNGNVDIEYTGSNEFARNIWQGILVRAGGLIRDAEKFAESDPNTVVALGRYFISNPDLVDRLQKKIPLTPYNRETFYATDPHDTRGYIEFKFASQQ
ncbi:Oye3p [Sugiyamaella lignohabitans]|uniref:Oye3p n=1 Tax=Sugiyamaella lignohabitans TaxID=796027 RepID=A0A161HGW5_9ASCO|nr:Oye3p [Sugiyamaella lignohabitans]ANB15040.1 Oye3p [Sugiyamaella lignohabitans]